MPGTRNVPAKVGSARGRVAKLTQSGADPDLIEQARADLEYAKAEASIARWRLPIEARARLARQLLLAGDDHATT